MARALGFLILLMKAPAEYKVKMSFDMGSLGISLLAADAVLVVNPASLWALRMPRNHHYNEDGYRWVAETVLDAISQDN